MEHKRTKIYYANHCLELRDAPDVGKEVDLSDLESLKAQHLAATEGHMLFYADELEQEEFLAQYGTLFTYIETGGGLVERDEQLLMIHRKGKWDCPKGKIESEEGILEAAKREIEEETGVTGLEMAQPLPNTYHIYEEKGAWVLKTGYWFVFETEYEGALTPQTEEDIAEAKWVPKTELDLATLDTYPSIKDLLSLYLDIFPVQ